MGGRAGTRRKLIALAVFVLAAAAAGGGLGYFLRLDLPDVRSLEDYTPPLMARVVGGDGSELATFADQRRILIDTPSIPAIFRQALLASEDADFERHTGIHFRGIARAAWRDLVQMRAAQGASTITQQLARNLFLRPEKTVRRKLQEMLLALEIERSFRKDEILRFYCNQVYMGHGRYGIEAASRFYFGKPARELDLPEAALLAGVIQRPEGLSPLKSPERATARRSYVLSRMVEEKYLTEAEAAVARAAPLGARAHGEVRSVAPHFVEEVRRALQARYGEVGIYQSGMEIRTTLDPTLQEIANRAVDRGLRELDKRRGWRGPAGRVPDGESPATWRPPSWKDEPAAGEVADGVVVSVAPGRAIVRVGSARGALGKKEIGWTRRSDPLTLLHAGDVVRVRVERLDGAGGAELSLEQEPNVEAALVALDPATGEVKALVGGRAFADSEFDRAVQAKRQAGSAFKPFVFAAALAAGKSLSDRILDEPTVFLDPTSPTPYQPENYGEHYYGLLTLREALARSANIATVKLLVEIGFAPVIELARRTGIASDLRAYPSLALGAFEVSLLEVTSAYGTFANQGVRVEPHLLREVLAVDGSVLERIEPEVHEAMSPQIAYLMTRALEGVVTDGTGAAAASLGRPLAGKTGTTDDFTDAWFVGYAPDLVVGVWVGFDAKKSLGSRETGAVAALPIWMGFMKEAYEGRPAEEFAAPPGIASVAVDRRTGLRANPSAGCAPVETVPFALGTEPPILCSGVEHDRLALPYPLQRFPLDGDGNLVVPSAEIDALLGSERSVRLDAGERSLEAATPGGSVVIPLRRSDQEAADPLPPEFRERAEREGWRGKDGRPARVVLIR